ncbi:hypothetical protein F0L68_12260 [Solihabitans fulvus]|uniref:PPE family protein n=1 Tax=Solihabitans fulvus TaxID=1892852 RepID=A0A5B2XGY9_9PSEU|nr:hypothetical protein [Solihabitans fulvus]KAA2262663.1 hypothetical protein F0L68_12260 [Solihabitans fulvus]
MPGDHAAPGAHIPPPGHHGPSFGSTLGQSFAGGLGGGIGGGIGNSMFNGGYGRYGADGPGYGAAGGEGGYGGGPGGAGDYGAGDYGDSGGNSYDVAHQLSRISSAVRDAGQGDGGVGDLGPTDNPLDAVSGLDIPGLPEMLQPMQEAMDWFAGNPGAIEAYAERWRRVAELARAAGDQFGGTVRKHTMEWTGPTAEVYRSHAQNQHTGLAGLAEAAECIVAIVEAGVAVAGTARAQIREAAAGCANDIVDRIPAWNAVLAADPTGGMNEVMADASAIVAGWA